MHSQRSRSASAYLVFSIILLVYLLSFSGFASTDDEQLFSTLTANLTHGRGYSALPLFGNDRLQGESGGVEPLHPILGIPFYLLAENLGLGKVQILYLLPAVYTALTAALLVVISEMKGYTSKTALLLGLLYGLGTIAFPYARTNFREPLAALLITTAILCSEKSLEQNLKNWGKFIYPACGVFALILSVLTKITTVILIPFLLVSFFTKNRQLGNGKNSKTFLLTLFGAIFAACIVLVLGLMLPNEGLSRFTFQFLEYIRYTLPRIPHDHFLSALAGLFFSPGKGLIIYSPILVLILFTPIFKQIKGTDWIIYFVALLALAIIQALIYDEQWWSISWGTRALLPALPLACLAALPVLDAGINSRNTILQFCTIFLMVSSGFIQIGRLLTSDPAYANWVVQVTGKSITSETLWNPRLAPMIQHWRLAFSNQVSDIAWLYINWRSMPTIPFLILIFSSGLLIALSFFEIRRTKKPYKASNIAALVLIVMLLIPGAAQFDQRYNRDVVVFKEISDLICKIAQGDDLVLIDAYLTPFWWYYANFGCDRSDWVGLPYLHHTAINTEIYYPRISDIQSMIQDKLNHGENVFLIQPQQEHRVSYSEEFESAGFIVKLLSTYENPGMHIFTLRLLD
jgi:hypothetical protein